ncbi:hypothetical protein IV203_008302 [Nitzschia inconspicua]|uniref:Calcineurin-like phosphoesterase domain-containing protein n=1 Tax=Nitzschia inconspicua TaxID=303405 RepID=A0A9K3KZF2_9STRA|nr:hypothetical protein IV203_008302 [Nitzschia inconspicua]
MVEVASPSSSFGAYTSPRSSPAPYRSPSSKKPLWLYCVYLLFGCVCFNAFLTYRRQKAFVRTTLAANNNDLMDDSVNADGSISYSAGAEEHVVSSNYGSSMYGGGIHTARSKPKTEPTRGARMAKLENNILPKPTNGTADFNARKSKAVAISNFEGFSFYVLTDTPFTDWQGKRLRSQMADLRHYLKDNPQRDNITFGVHLGNTQQVSNSLCMEESYNQTAYLLAKGPRPTLVVPGNSDWFDCPFRDKSMELFLKYYGPDFIPKEWHAEHYEPLHLERSEKNPELFVFYFEGILFIGVHLLHVQAEEETHHAWDRRMKINMEWVASSVETYFVQHNIRGVVVFGHAPRTARTRPFFVSMSNYFLNITSRQDIPVMYLHGHGNGFQVDTKFSNETEWYSFVDVQIHPSGVADPVLVDIAPQVQGKVQALPEENNMQTTLFEGLVRIDRRKGIYEDPMDIPKRNLR